MRETIFIFQILFGVLSVLVILLQQKGSGLGSTFGGELGMYRTKRGAEKLIFRLTILFVILFIISTIAGLML